MLKTKYIFIPLLCWSDFIISNCFSFYKNVNCRFWAPTSVGSNPKITNFELLRTLEVELRTLSNPGLPTKTELRTHPNPPKIPNSEPTNPTVLNILEKSMNFELLRTLEVELRTLPNPGSPTKTELRTHPNPPKIPNSEPTNWIRPNTRIN